MNKRFMSVLLFAVVVAGLASVVLYLQIRGRLGTETTPTKTQIVVATRQLEIGSVIKEGDVKTVPWASDLPQGALSTPEAAFKRGVISTIYASEPVLQSRLAAEGAGGGLAATIPKGMRAVGLKVDQVIGVAGFVVPGMRVDVIVAGNPGRDYADRGTMSKMLLQNIEVLSAGQNIQRDAEGKPIQVQVVNVLVTPEQAERVTLASSEARIQLILRNPLDQDEVSTSGAEFSGLFTGMAPRKMEAPPAAAPRRAAPVAAPVQMAPPPKPTVEVIHGLERTQKTIDPNVGGAL
ncbi:MAG: Flp pilus assembly protein CpaB [Bryobacterales bacterium]|nr:Flp pilus assembly protein CpaB [Bryobacterales bacterium]